MSEKRKQKQETAVVPVQSLVPTNGTLIPQVGTPILSCPTNIDTSTRQGRALVFKGTSPGDYDQLLSAGQPVALRLTHFLCYPDERIDEETGELHQFTRSVLYDREGKTLRMTGAHIPHRIVALTDVYSPEEWAEGLPIVVAAYKSKRGRMYHDIRMVME